MTVSPWLLIVLSVPVILLGQVLVRRVRVFNRFSIPVPVVGGLLVAVAVLVLNLSGATLTLQKDLFADKDWASGCWLWITQPLSDPKQPVHLPLLLGFFTCVGLNASWTVARRGGVQLVVFLGLATALTVLQNGLGVGIAKLIGAEPMLGLLCGSVAMTGGHGTALGLAPGMEAAGFASAGVVGAAAATFGLVAGSLIGGPIGTLLIRNRKLHAPTGGHTLGGAAQRAEHEGFISQIVTLGRLGGKLALHLALLLACIKVGAWVSYGLRSTGMTLPAYMGALLTGIVVRNVLDATGSKRLRVETDVVDLMASVLLAVFLVLAMMTLNLIDLSKTAGPMLAILVPQVVMMAAFAYWLTFRCMGRDYEAAVMAGGHCGFGLGATPNAVANMEALTAKYGHAPRAFLVVTTVGAFLIDFTNSLVISLFYNRLM